MNVFCATGNLGRDAETREVGQHTVTSFSIAVRAGFGDKETTFWLNCNAWNKGGVAQYLKKGSQVGVTGELSVKEYDKKDGTKGQSIELRVANIDLPPKSAGGNQQDQASASSKQDRANTSMDTIPF